MYRISLVVCLAVMCEVGLLNAAAMAQGLPQRPGVGRAPEKPPGDVKNVKIKGSIKGIRGDVMYVANEKGGEWLVKMPSGPQATRVVGSAVLPWVKPGMLVRFSGMFDSEGKPQGPIDRLEVFTYRPPREGQQPERPGVFSEASLVGAEMFKEPNAVTPAANAVQSYIIIGQLRGFKDGAISVAAGPTMVQATLAPETEIAVDLADYRLARLGDEIELSGWHYPLVKTQVYANHVTIRSAEPIGKDLTVKPKPPAVPPGTPPPPQNKAAGDDLPF